MKHYGSKLEFENERNEDLMRAYHELIDSCDFISLHKIYEEVVNRPSSRFWVSPERASVVVSSMMRGEGLSAMRPTKREMFEELYQRTILMRRKYPSMSVYEIAFIVVHQPAPKFYMTPKYAKSIIFYTKRKWYEEKKRKLRHLF